MTGESEGVDDVGRLGRRKWLKLFGTALVSAGAGSVTREHVDTCSGYGEGGYGDGGYGGSSGLAVTTAEPSGVDDTAATLNGTLGALGCASSVEVHFVYRETGTSSWDSSPTRTLWSTGPVTVDVSGLNGSTEYEFRAVAAASDGDAATGDAVTFGTDGSATAPAIDRFTVSETGSPNSHPEITADWAVSDADGDLEGVLVEVIDGSGSVLNSSSTGVDGSTASGTDEFTLKTVDDGTFGVALTVGDGRNDTTTTTRLVTG